MTPVAGGGVGKNIRKEDAHIIYQRGEGRASEGIMRVWEQTAFSLWSVYLITVIPSRLYWLGFSLISESCCFACHLAVGLVVAALEILLGICFCWWAGGRVVGWIQIKGLNLLGKRRIEEL